MDVTVYIPSRGRPNCRNTTRLFPAPILFIAESEADVYRAQNPGVKVLTHPDSMIGMARKRQWLWDHCETEALFMVDDDIPGLAALVGNTQRSIKDPRAVQDVLAVTAQCAKDAGTVLFGFQHTADTRHFQAMSPFGFRGFIDGCAMGLVGRDKRIRFDVRLTCSLDIDISLQVLLHRRILWRDSRFGFYHYNTLRGTARGGGMAGLRTADSVAQDARLLMEKWGSALDISREKRITTGKQQRVRIHVKR
jgi:hypothetical protein